MRGRVALGRVTLSSEYPLGLWRGWAYVHFPLDRHRLSGAGSRAAAAAVGCARARPARDAAAATTPISPACANTSAAIRCSASHGRRWRAAPAGTRRQFEGAGGGGPITLDWYALPARSRRRDAAVAAVGVGARGRTRGAAVRAARCPATALPTRHGREHRRAALTALALFPHEDADVSADARGQRGSTRRRARVGVVAAADAAQIRWLGALLVARAVAAGACTCRSGSRLFGVAAGRRCASCCCAATARGPLRHAGAHSVVGARASSRSRSRSRSASRTAISSAAIPASRSCSCWSASSSSKRARCATARCSCASRLPARSRRSSTASRCSPRSRRCRPCSLLGGDAGVARARRGESRRSPRAWRDALRRTAKMIAQGIADRRRCCSCCSRASRAPLWGLPADRAARDGPVRPHGAGLDQRAVAVRRRRVSRRFRRPAAAAAAALLARPGAVAVRRPRMALRCRRCPAAGSRRATARRSAYTVTLEPNDQPWLFALDLPSSLPQIDSRCRLARGRGPALARLTRDQQLLIARAGHAAAALHADVDAARQLPGGRRRASARLNLARCRRGNPRTVAFARELRAAHPDDRRFVAPCCSWFRDEPFVYTLAPPLLERGPGRRVPVRHAARLLRALRERVRRHAARGGHSGARGHRLPGRRDQSAAAAT